jgi:UDP-N-acetyl-2-amino-2-deoxyglucuronate dehydrogenase
MITGLLKRGFLNNFVMIGAGYVAPQHVQAIQAIGGNLVAFTDPYDGVGWMDEYFPNAQYFREFERFDRYVDKFIYKDKIDYVCVCSPNYLHDAHCRWGLRIGADVICEKPLVCHSRNLNGLERLESETGHKVWTILQLRLHRNAVEAKLKYSDGSTGHQVRVRYFTPRGAWYDHSWKGDVAKSGGVATNIGVHLFDLVAWLFGPMDERGYEFRGDIDSGVVSLERAFVNWQLSISQMETPQRIFEIDGARLDFSEGFAGLHTRSYENILDGSGFGIDEAAESIKICERIRNGN